MGVIGIPSQTGPIAKPFPIVDDDPTNKCGQFTAANTEFLSRATNSSLQAGAGNFSCGCWMYLDSKGALRSGLMKDDFVGTQREYSIYYFNVDDRFYFSVSSNGVTLTHAVASTFGSPSLSTWYFVQGWYDGTNISISVNNGTANTTAFSAGIFNGTSPFMLGAHGTVASPQEPMNGRIDQPYIAKSNLGSTVRTSLYNSGVGKKWSQLTGSERNLFSGYWNLFEASGSRIDETANANTLTDNNTVTQNPGVTV